MPVLAAAAAAVFSAATTFATAVGTAALASAGLGSLATMGIASFTGSLTIGTLVGALQIGSTALSLFSAMKKPKAGAGGPSPLAWKADPNAYIPVIAGGPVATGGNQVFAQTAGSKNRWVQYTTILSHCGPCASVMPFKANDEVVNFSRDGGQGAEGRYKDRFWMKTALGFVGAAATIISATGTKYTPANNGGLPPEWTAAHKLSGMAHAVESLWADPERVPQIPKHLWEVIGGPVYDARKDSTQPGGVGTQRWNDRSTWSTDGNTNPYLQALTFSIGHTFNGVRVAGVGAPLRSIDVAAFVYGANVADANGWKIAWQWHTGMRKWDVLATMLQAGGGLPLVRGSKISCMVDAPRVSIGTITDADLRGDFSVTGCSSIRDRKNAIIPRCKSQAHNWSVQPHGRIAPAVYLAEDGGVDRTVEVEYESVSDPVQVRQLASLELSNLREGLAAVIPVSASFLKYRAGDCLTVNASKTLLTGQKIVVVKREFNHKTRTVNLTVRSETDGKHAYAMGQVAAPPPSPSLVGADPTIIQPPAPEAWVPVTGQAPGGGGEWVGAPGDPEMPVIIFEAADPGEDTGAGGAATDDPAATEVIIRYRRTGTDPSTALPYAWASETFPARSDRLELKGLAPGVQYELEMAYKVRGITSDFTPYGYLTTGGLLSTDAMALGGRQAQDVLDELDAATLAIETAVANTNLAIAALDLRVDAVEVDINDPATGLKVRVGANETATATVADRVTVVELSINTPVTGLSARTASLETATANLQTGKADASRVTLVEARALALERSPGDLRNPNPDFMDWPSGPLPGTWGFSYSAGTTTTKVPGYGGEGYAVDVTVAAAGQHEISQSSATVGSLAPGWHVLEADVQLVSGSWQYGGLRLFGYDSAGAYLNEGQYLQFAVDKDVNGNVLGSTPAPGSYSFRHLVHFANPATSRWYFGASAGGLFGTIPVPGRAILRRAGWRPATAAEVETRQARGGFTDLSARYVSLETATANLQTGKADASRVTLVEARVSSAEAVGLFLNETFSNWPGAVSDPPADWTKSEAGSAGIGRVAGVARPYAARLFNLLSSDTTALVTPYLPGLSGYYVVEAEYTLTSGTLDGAALVCRGDSAVGYVNEGYMYLNGSSGRDNIAGDGAANTSPASDGTLPGAGVAGRTYRMSKLIRLRDTSGTITQTRMFAFGNGINNYSGAGGAGAKDITLHRARMRVATPSEIEQRDARGGFSSLSARAISTETAVANLQTGKADATRVTALEVRAGGGNMLRASQAFTTTLTDLWAESGGGMTGPYYLDTDVRYKPAGEAYLYVGKTGGTGYRQFIADNGVGVEIIAGKRYCCSLFLAGDYGQVLGLWRAADGSYLGEMDVNTNAGSGVAWVPPGPALGSYKRVWALGTAPAGAARLYLYFLARGDLAAGGGTFWAALRPMVSEATATQTEAPPWSPPSVEARTRVVETASADLYGRTYARWAIGAAVSGADAFIEARAETTPGAAPTSSVAIGARQFSVYNQLGANWLKALSVEGGNVLLSGGLQAGAFIRLGNGVGWPVALKSVDFNATDGGAVSFGTDLGALPSLTFAMNNLLPLAAGETYDVKATGLTSTGFTLSAKINVPGTPTSYDGTVSYTSSAFGSGGIFIDKTPDPVSADGTYRIMASGTNQHDIVGTAGGPLMEDSYDYVTGEVQVWAYKAGAWVYITSVYVGSVVDRRSYPAYFQSVAGSWTLDQTLTLGDGVLAVGLRHATPSASASVGAFTHLIWTAPGTSTGTRTALASGATTRIKVQPQ